MMNGLYGKTIQRPILDENVIIHLHGEFIKFHIKYRGVSIRSMSYGSFYLTYQDESKLATKISKHATWEVSSLVTVVELCWITCKGPILISIALTPKINLTMHLITRILVVFKFMQRTWRGWGWIMRWADDLPGKWKILYGGWIAPKLYFLEYVNEEGEIKYHLCGKGITKDQLNIENFKLMMQGESIKVEMQRDFKRVNLNKSSKQQNVENFSILKLDALTKQINSTPWKGRHFIGNSSVPHNHHSAN